MRTLNKGKLKLNSLDLTSGVRKRSWGQLNFMSVSVLGDSTRIGK